MQKKFKAKKRTSGSDNNRLHIIMAIIFLCFLSIGVKLYSIQIINFDLYTVLAAKQHQVNNELLPERGRIFIKDNIEGKTDALYPIASNKEFAHVYVIPKKISQAEEVSLKLYEILDRAELESELEKRFSSDEWISSSTKIKKEDLSEEAWKEFVELKKKEELELRRGKIINKYKEKLSKENDPYEPIKRKVDEKKLEEIKALEYEGVEYLMETFRFYPEKNTAAHILGFVNYENEGHYGLEGFFNEELAGIKGMVKTERAAGGKLIIINDREYVKQKDGSDLILSIDRSIQFHSCKKLQEAIGRYGAESGSVIVMNPFNGAIIAMCNYPDFDPNNYSDTKDANVFNNKAIFDAYEPGSIFKAITIATGIDQEEISPNSLYNDKGFVMIEGWNKPIKNSDFETHGGHGWVDMNTVLSESLNTGTIYVQKKIGDEIFADYVKKFGFGEKTGIELEGEGVTNIANLNRKTKRPIEMATASFGQGISATSLQMIAAYSAIANGGILMKPYLVEEIVNSNGERVKTKPVQIRRVISEKTAFIVSGMLVNVIDGGHAKLAKVDGYYAGGKTGTAQVAEGGAYGSRTIHTFVGFAPVDEPKAAIMIKLNNPSEVRYAASSAAPLFAEITKYLLDYYKVPKER